MFQNLFWNCSQNLFQIIFVKCRNVCRFTALNFLCFATAQSDAIQVKRVAGGVLVPIGVNAGGAIAAAAAGTPPPPLPGDTDSKMDSDDEDDVSVMVV